MNLNNLYKELECYDFSKLDICTKEYAITSLICHIKNLNKSEYLLRKNEIDISENEYLQLKEYLNEIIYNKIPLQYIIGKVYLYNEEYSVNEHVLIPRQDTEILIENAVNYINKYNLKKGLDLCCGSGAIGISVSKNSNLKEITFVDISEKALEVTKKNIENNNVKTKTNVIHSNLFNTLMTDKNKYDIIMSNPPYIKSSDIDNLSEYVKNEPILALDGGQDGLFFYNKIIDEARNFLNENGFLIFEIGYDQMDELINIFSKYKEYEIVEKIKDYNLNDRVIICRFHKT